jgi:glycosyltransferase involved in cell wall biosynthesis
MGIDVLIPVLNRPQNAAKVAESLKVTREPYRLVFICSPRDTAEIEACRKVGEVLIVPWNPGKGDFAKKINHGFRQTSAEWVFQGADDIIFYPDWDKHALGKAERKRKRVIGTNDRHNPSVRKGTHSTHTLFARSYVEERPATVDESDPVFFEGYDHQYVDLEFVEVAKARNEWVFAQQSFVEHFHPHWGNAERDSTYLKAFRAHGRDRMLYMQRMGIKSRSRQSARVMERQERLKARRKRDIPTT